MKVALVTGASSGIGYEIAKTLLNMNYEVYGVARNFIKNETKIFEDYENFFPIVCDLAKLDELEKTLHSLKKIKFDLIVNSAGLAYFGLHEEINIAKIKNMISVNLQAPLVISQYFLRTLKENKGTIINISSVTANKESPLACVYSATKAGLSQFSKSLFEEVRKNDVKVITIYPDMTKTNFYQNNTYFECDDDEKSILGSGSSGNSTFVEIEDYKLLVDTGFSCKKTEEKLEMIGKKLSDISAILITHEHSDHINGAGVIARKYDIPIYITPESYKAGVGKLGEIDKSLIKFIDGSFILDDKVKVSPFDVMHDAERTIGFKLESQLNKKIAISTDIGYITNIVREYFKDVDAMVIESNYDFNTLMNCSYPWNLKERVKSRNGHLSNNECAKFIKEMYTDKLKKVFLAHVSKDSNHLNIIKETLEDEFTGMLRKPNCEITSQDKVTKLFTIE